MHIHKSLAVRPSSNWLRGLRAYFVTIAVGNLFWESAQLPLYTIWHTGTARQLVFAVIHCLIGDLLIALSALMLALFIAGNELWPTNGYRRIVALALIFGVAYTTFSEWLNVVVRTSWAYSEWMPLVSAFGLRIGLSPLLQWIVVPAIAFALTSVMTAKSSDCEPKPHY